MYVFSLSPACILEKLHVGWGFFWHQSSFFINVFLCIFSLELAKQETELAFQNVPLGKPKETEDQSMEKDTQTVERYVYYIHVLYM